MTAILHDAGRATLPMTRAKMAYAKESELQDLASLYRASRAGQDVADAIDAAVIAFRRARTSIRNELLHAHPFTAGQDAEGRYLPGLAYTARDGKSWKTVSRTPEDLLDLATEIESALDPMSTARTLVRERPLASL